MSTAPAINDPHPAQPVLRRCLAMLQRSYGSIELVDRGRIAAALLDRDGRVVAASPAAPIGNLEALAATARAFAGGLEPGDVMLTNDPYAGGTRVSDQFVLSPLARGGLAAVCAPAFDVGGTRLGNHVPEALDLFAEGVRITPVRLARAGGVDADVIRLLRLNSRVPVLAEADARALLAAVHDLAATAASPGAASRSSAELVAAALAGREATAAVGSVTLDIRGTTFDFTGSAAQQASHHNATLATTRSAVAFAIRDHLGSSLDSGVLAALDVLTHHGTVVDCAPPAAVGGSIPDDVRAAVAECLR